MIFMVLGWDKQKTYGRFPVEERESEPRRHMSPLAKKALRYTAIGAGIIGTIFGAYKLDDFYVKENKEELRAVYNAAREILDCERKSNYARAKKLEDELWTWISLVEREGRLGISGEDLTPLKKMLNENNTSGTPRGQPLD